jgi:dihydroxynaphthoic acid synthetase
VQKSSFHEDFTDIIFSVSDGVAHVVINRPERMNAFRSETMMEMVVALERAATDPEVGVIVLTGAGNRAFCAGGDVEWEANGGLEDRKGDDAIRRVYTAMRRGNKPIIARVNGYAIGGGNHLAYMCDFTIASDNAIFGQNGPRVASPAEGWIVSYLVRVLGAKRAREMWMLCRRYPASLMLEWGLVNAVVPQEDLDEEVRQWCEELLALSPTALKTIRASFEDEYAALRDRQDQRNFLAELNPSFFESGEHAEGAGAFLEKRRPEFQRWR